MSLDFIFFSFFGSIDYLSDSLDDVIHVNAVSGSQLA
jgi:hypothetical protein